MNSGANMNSSTFDFATWQMRIQLQVGAFEEMDKMVTDPELRDKHLDKSYPRPKLSRAPQGIFTGSELLRLATEGSISSAHGVYLRQMIVVIATLLETICFDHLELLFVAKPDCMIGYTHNGGDMKFTGLVHLREILVHTKERLLITLAARASKRIVDLPHAKRFKKIEELSNQQIPAELRGQLMEIVELRNKIVHENNQDEVGQHQLYTYFKCLEDFLIWCAHRLEELNVPVRWDNRVE
jgi:hypothetical protein